MNNPALDLRTRVSTHQFADVMWVDRDDELVCVLSTSPQPVDMENLGLPFCGVRLDQHSESEAKENNCRMRQF